MIIKIRDCFVHMNTRNQSKPFISVAMLSAIAIMLYIVMLNVMEPI